MLKTFKNTTKKQLYACRQLVCALFVAFWTAPVFSTSQLVYRSIGPTLAFPKAGPMTFAIVAFNTKHEI